LPRQLAHEDAEDLPHADASFDAVLSTFGIPFTPSPERVASEVLRVLRPGGRFAFTHWTTTGVNAAESRAVERFAPDDGPPSPWVSEARIRGLFGDGVTQLEVKVRQVIYRFDSIQQYVDVAMTRFGPFMRLADALALGDRAALRSGLIDALAPFNRSDDDTMVMPFEYHEVVATRR
jgi:SAM-dependent methyltransferase